MNKTKQGQKGHEVTAIWQTNHQDLIIDVLKHIFSFLPVRSRAKIGEVSKHWCQVSRDPFLWPSFEITFENKQTKKGTNYQVSQVRSLGAFLQKYCTNLVDLNICFHYAHRIHDRFDEFFQITSLKRLKIQEPDVGQEYVPVKVPACTGLQLLNLNAQLGINSITKILSGLPDLKELYLPCTDEIQTEAFAAATKLERLALDALDYVDAIKLADALPSLKFIIFYPSRMDDSSDDEEGEVIKVGKTLIVRAEELQVENLKTHYKELAPLLVPYMYMADQSKKSFLTSLALNYKRNKEVIKFLVQEKGFDLNYTYSPYTYRPSFQTRTIIFADEHNIHFPITAVCRGDTPSQLEAVQELLSLGADAECPSNDISYLNTPNAAVRMLLLQRGANPNKIVEHSSIHLKVPVFAVHFLDQKFEDSEEFVRMLKDKVNLNAAVQSKSLLQWAIELKKWASVSALISLGVKWNEKDLSALLKGDTSRFQQLLVNKSIDINALPIRVIVEAIHENMAPCLAEYLQANIYKKNEFGYNLLHILATTWPRNDTNVHYKRNDHRPADRWIVSGPVVPTDEPKRQKLNYKDEIEAVEHAWQQAAQDENGSGREKTETHASLAILTSSLLSQVVTTEKLPPLDNVKIVPVRQVTSISSPKFGVGKKRKRNEVDDDHMDIEDYTVSNNNNNTNRTFRQPMNRLFEEKRDEDVRRSAEEVHEDQDVTMNDNDNYFEGDNPTDSNGIPKAFIAQLTNNTNHQEEEIIEEESDSEDEESDSEEELDSEEEESDSEDEESDSEEEESDPDINSYYHPHIVFPFLQRTQEKRQKTAYDFDWTQLFPLYNSAINLQSNDGETALLLVCKAHLSDKLKQRRVQLQESDHAVSIKHKRVECLIANGADVNLADNQGWTPLHAACYANAWDDAAALIKAKANVNAQDQNGITPIMAAVYGWHHMPEKYYESSKKFGEALLTLLMVMKDVDFSLTEKHTNRTFLHMISSINISATAFTEIFERLRLRDREPRDVDGFTPLHYSTMYGANNVVKKLVEFGCDINCQTTAMRITPAMIYLTIIASDFLPQKPYKICLENCAMSFLANCHYKDIKISAEDRISLVVESSWNFKGEKPHGRDYYGCTTLEDIPDTLSFLLKNSDLTLTDSCGNNYLHYLVMLYTQTPEEVAACCKKYPTLNSLWNQKNSRNITPLHMWTDAIGEFPTDEATKLIIDIIMTLDIDIMELYGDGRSIFSWICSTTSFRCYPDAWSKLEAQIDFTKKSRDLDDTTALTTMTIDRPITTDILAYISKKNPELLLSRDRHGCTLLIKEIEQTVQDGEFATEGPLTILLQKQLINQQDNNGDTALHIACRYFTLGFLDSIAGHRSSFWTAFGYNYFAFILLEVGADPTIKNKRGETSLSYVPRLMEYYEELYKKWFKDLIESDARELRESLEQMAAREKVSLGATRF